MFIDIVDIQIISISAAVFGFEQSSYIVDEYNITVQICVQLRDGQLGTELTLKLQTHNGTAQGKTFSPECLIKLWCQSNVSKVYLSNQKNLKIEVFLITTICAILNTTRHM